MTARTKAALMRAMRAKRRRGGMVRLDTWVHQLDLPAILRQIEECNKRRGLLPSG